MNYKILSLVLASTLVLGACGGDDSKPTGETTTIDEIEDISTIVKNENKNEVEKSQEEINLELKDQAVEADFVDINGNKDAQGIVVYAKGKISNVDYDNVMDFVPSFLLAQEEGDGFGIYHITNILSFEGLEDGDIVTIYGKVDKPGEDGIPKIVSPVIEPE